MAEGATGTRGASIFETLVQWILSLPTDIKILIEMIGDDGLDMRARSLAVGALVYLVATIGLIPDVIPVLGYVDDVLVLHIALAIILEIDPERAKYYRAKYADAIGALDAQIALVADALGALYSWLRAFVEALRNRQYKGKTTQDAAQSDEARENIFDDAMVYAANVEVDEKAIRQRLLASPPEQLIKLLSDGLEKEQKRQAEEERKTGSGILSGTASSIRKLLDREKKE